jgi:hypothetical protein
LAVHFDTNWSWHVDTPTFSAPLSFFLSFFLSLSLSLYFFLSISFFSILTPWGHLGEGRVGIHLSDKTENFKIFFKKQNSKKSFQRIENRSLKNTFVLFRWLYKTVLFGALFKLIWFLHNKIVQTSIIIATSIRTSSNGRKDCHRKKRYNAPPFFQSFVRRHFHLYFLPFDTLVQFVNHESLKKCQFLF